MSHSHIVNTPENNENDETDSFSDGGDLGCLSAGSTGVSRVRLKMSDKNDSLYYIFSNRTQFIKWFDQPTVVASEAGLGMQADSPTAHHRPDRPRNH